MFGRFKRRDPAAPIKLDPLTPKYIEEEHGIYVNILNAALKDSRIQNIALSGNYGVGKSSILKKIAEAHKRKVLELSLSTLAPIEQTKGDEGPPPQATSPTNTIQQEIVKQLLYREKPRRTPGSRFRRIEKFHWLREALLSLLIGTILATTFLIMEWTNKILLAIPNLQLETPWSHASIMGVGALIFVLLRHTLYGRLNIKEVSAGTATVTLDEKSVSYFDQYLDEIVYFFEVSKRTIVIFEDIDRFNDAHIFETLRSLNALLNGSPQIKKHIYFIYAIKDSIFDRLTIAQDGRRFNHDLRAGDDPAESEVVRANRTKFFDLVIPVVPFITHQNARNLTVQLLKGIEHSVSLDLIDLASRYVPDMRLLKNVRNEFLIFRERIISSHHGGLNLSESELFAMMLYKSTHFSDFEAIRIGKSNIDELYKKSRMTVSTNLQKFQREILELQRIDRLDLAIESRGPDLGKRLIEYMKVMAAACQRNYEIVNFKKGGHSLSDDDLLTGKFWRNFIKEDGDPTLEVELRPRYNNGNQLALSFKRSDLEGILGPLYSNSLKDFDRKKNLESQKSLQNQIRFIKSADFMDLMARNDLTVNGTNGDISLDRVAKDIFKDGLAYQLLRYGYINRNYTLYTAVFHGDRMSSAATNFIIHHIDRDSRDENFPLTGADVDSIVRERSSQFGEPAFYNIDILDHILKNRASNKVVELMINSLSKLGEEQKYFLEIYLKRGSERSSLVELISLNTPKFLDYLGADVDIEHIDRLTLFNTALLSISPAYEYALSEKSAQFIASNYEELEIISSDETSTEQLENLAGLIEETGLTFTSLTPMSKKAREIFGSRSLYNVTLENLKIILDTHDELAIDVIRDMNKVAYTHLMAHLSEYLSCIDGISPSIFHQRNFAQILLDAASSDKATLEKLIKMASENCVLEEISKTPTEAWGLLAKNRRFTATLHNVKSYLEENKEVDEKLIEVLRRPEAISEVGETEEEKNAVALTLLRAKELLSPTERAKLCASLKLTQYIDAALIEPEEGELFAELIARDVVEDALPTYTRLQGLSWKTKEEFIATSREFQEFVTPNIVGNDLEMLLKSPSVGDSVKARILANATAYADASDLKGMTQLGRYAAEKMIELDFELIDSLARAKLDADIVLKLLGMTLNNITAPQVLSVLRNLGDDYANLTEPGKDRPKVPDTPDVTVILDFLISSGIVNSYGPDKGFLRVNKKHK